MSTPVTDSPAAATGAEANEAVIRSLYAAFNRRDVDRMLEHMSPDIRWYTFDLTLKPDVYRGRREVERFLRNVLGDYSKLLLHTDWLVAEGATVTAAVSFDARRVGDQAASGYQVVHVWTLKDRLATQHRLCLTPRKAKKIVARRPREREHRAKERA